MFVYTSIALVKHRIGLHPWVIKYLSATVYLDITCSLFEVDFVFSLDGTGSVVSASILTSGSSSSVGICCSTCCSAMLLSVE